MEREVMFEKKKRIFYNTGWQYNFELRIVTCFVKEDYPTRRTSFVQVILRLINDPYIQIILTPIEPAGCCLPSSLFFFSLSFFFFFSTSVTDGRIHWPRVLLVESVTCTNDKKNFIVNPYSYSSRFRALTRKKEVQWFTEPFNLRINQVWPDSLCNLFNNKITRNKNFKNLKNISFFSDSGWNSTKIVINFLNLMNISLQLFPNLEIYIGFKLKIEADRWANINPILH